MQTVLFTSVFQRHAKNAGLTDNEILEIASVLAADPLAGDLMPGTGGARKLRHAGREHGKRGGFRSIHYYGGDDVPIFLLALVDKGNRAGLSPAEKKEVAQTLPRIADAYRAGMRSRT